MKLLVDLAQSLVRDVGIDLRSTDITMSQHHLNRAEVGPVFKEVSGKTVPEQVRRNMTNACSLTQRHYYSP